jgi:prevent-host-death family protein
VGVRELRDRLSHYLAGVKAGQEIVVTEHGRPVARLVPLGARPDRLAELIAAGRAQPPKTTRRHLPRPVQGAGPVSDLVRDQRR